MADKKINIDILINTGDAASSLKDIKKSVKDLEDAALKIGESGEGFSKLTQKAGELKNKLGDLRDTTNSLNGSGVEKLNASMGLMREAFTNADPGKLSAGFKVMGAAMKAIPIFLIIEGIKWLVENFEKLTQSGGVVGKVFGFIKDVIDTVIQAFKDLTDWLGLTNNAIEDNAEKTIAAAKRSGDAIVSRYDDEIKLAKAAGKNTDELEIKKQEAIIETSRVAVNALKTIAQANGKLTDAEMKQLEDLVKTIHAAEIDIQAKKLTIAKTTADEKDKIDKKSSDDYKAREDKRIKESGKAWEDEIKAKSEREKAESDRLEQESLADKKAEEDRIKTSGEEWEAENKIKADAEKTESDRLETQSIKDLEDHKAKQKGMVDAAKMANDSLMDLSNLFFSVKNANLKKGSAEEEKAARQQFKINKALAISGAVITGIQSVMAAFASGVATPIIGPATGAVYAIMAGITAAANIAKIASMQFQGGGGGGAASVGSAPSVPSAASTPASFNPTSFGINSGAAGVNNNINSRGVNTPQAQRVYVVQTDIEHTNNQVQVLQARAHF